MIRKGLIAAAVLLPGFSAAQDAVYTFDWPGAGGYEMRGAMSFPAELLDGPRVIEHDIACFQIEGFRDGRKVGEWGLAMLDDETTWSLNFDPQQEAFVVYGGPIGMPQAWNMNGEGFNCGASGFGFNIGGAAQDLCIDNQLIYDSQIDPSRPFPAERAPAFDFAPYACLAPPMLSYLDPKATGAARAVP